MCKPLSRPNRKVTEWTPRDLEQSHRMFQYDHSCFEKKQLACYWAVLETACPVLGHEVTMQSGWSVEHQALQVDTEQHSISEGRGTSIHEA